jgi:hypothetical protein
VNVTNVLPGRRPLVAWLLAPTVLVMVNMQRAKETRFAQLPVLELSQSLIERILRNVLPIISLLVRKTSVPLVREEVARKADKRYAY